MEGSKQQDSPQLASPEESSSSNGAPSTSTSPRSTSRDDDESTSSTGRAVTEPEQEPVAGPSRDVEEGAVVLSPPQQEVEVGANSSSSLPSSEEAVVGAFRRASASQPELEYTPLSHHLGLPCTRPLSSTRPLSRTRPSLDRSSSDDVPSPAGDSSETTTASDTPMETSSETSRTTGETVSSYEEASNGEEMEQQQMFSPEVILQEFGPLQMMVSEAAAGPRVVVMEMAGVSGQWPVGSPAELEPHSAFQEDVGAEGVGMAGRGPPLPEGGTSTEGEGDEEEEARELPLLDSSTERRKRGHSVESRSSDEVKRRVLLSSQRPLLAADSPLSISTPETSLSPPGDSTSDTGSSQQEGEEGDGSSGDLAPAQLTTTTTSSSTTAAGDDSSQVPMQESESLREAGELTSLMQEDVGEPAEPAEPAGGGLLEVPSAADIWADSDPCRVTVMRRRRHQPRLLPNVPSPARRVLRLPSVSSPDSPLTGALQEVQGQASTSHSDSTGDSKGGDHSSPGLLPETESSREAGEVKGLMAELQATLLEGQADTEDAAGSSDVVADVFQAALSDISPDTGGHPVQSRSSDEVNRRVLRSSRRSLLDVVSQLSATSAREAILSAQGGSTSDTVSSQQEGEEGDGSSGDLAPAQPTTTAGEVSSQEPMQEGESLCEAGELTSLMQGLQTGKEGAGGGAQGVGEPAEPAGGGLLEVPSAADILADRTRAAGVLESPVQQQQVEGAGEMEERAAVASSIQSEVSLAGEGQQQGTGAEVGGAELEEEPGEGQQQGRRRKRRGTQEQTYKAGWKKRGRK